MDLPIASYATVPDRVVGLSLEPTLDDFTTSLPAGLQVGGIMARLRRTARRLLPGRLLPAAWYDSAAKNPCDFDVLCRSARIGLWRQHAGSRMVDVSAVAQQLLGLPTSRVSEAEAQALLPADNRERLRTLQLQVRLTLKPSTLEAPVAHPRHGQRHLRWHIGAETDRRGRFVALVGSVQDVTEWRSAEERRQQASRMDALGQLAAGLAHDFNNLLCNVVLNLDMLEEGAAAPHAARGGDLVRRARAAAEKGAELTAQLLAFAGKHPAQRQPLDIAHALHLAAAAAVTPRGVSIDVTTASDCGGAMARVPDIMSPVLPLAVEADPMLLRSALQTLIAHAVQCSPDGAAVRAAVTACRLDAAMAANVGVIPGRYASLTVADQGEALAPEMLPRLFEPFFRPRADGTDPSASGVGMAMVHGFARGHGGTVGLERLPGGGTVARLLLPLAPDSVARTLAASPPAPLGAGVPIGRRLAGLRILLVEDDADVRETTTLLLMEDGAAVTTAEDALAALAVLEGDAPFDLLLSDVVLPGGLSGIDVVEGAASLRPGLPALLASGYAAPAQELGRMVPSGVILLRKPYRHGDLLDAIASTLGAAGSRRAA